MTDESLIAPVESTHRAWTGFGLADSIEGLVTAIQNGSWIDGALAGAGTVLEGASYVMDPISNLLAAGLSWAMEYFEPLREMLDELTGKPDVVMSHAQTWNNMADELFAIAEELQGHLTNDMPGWSGSASEAYQELMGNNVDGIGGLGAISVAIAAATEGAGALVQFTRDLVRDLIADLVARVIVWTAEAIFVVTIPVIASQIAAAVVKWAGRILFYMSALVTSLTNLNKLLND